MSFIGRPLTCNETFFEVWTLIDSNLWILHVCFDWLHEFVMAAVIFEPQKVEASTEAHRSMAEPFQTAVQQYADIYSKSQEASEALPSSPTLDVQSSSTPPIASSEGEETIQHTAMEVKEEADLQPNVEASMQEGGMQKDEAGMQVKEEGSTLETLQEEETIMETVKEEGSIMETVKEEGSTMETVKEEGAAMDETSDTVDHPEARLYCFCRREDNGVEAMIACDSCDEWFHEQCLGSEEWLKAQSMNQWKCPNCLSNSPNTHKENNSVGEPADPSNQQLCQSPKRGKGQLLATVANSKPGENMRWMNCSWNQGRFPTSAYVRFLGQYTTYHQHCVRGHFQQKEFVSWRPREGDTTTDEQPASASSIPPSRRRRRPSNEITDMNQTMQDAESPKRPRRRKIKIQPDPIAQPSLSHDAQRQWEAALTMQVLSEAAGSQQELTIVDDHDGHEEVVDDSELDETGHTEFEHTEYSDEADFDDTDYPDELTLPHERRCEQRDDFYRLPHERRCEQRDDYMSDDSYEYAVPSFLPQAKPKLVCSTQNGSVPTAGFSQHRTCLILIASPIIWLAIFCDEEESASQLTILLCCSGLGSN
eukprot:g67612.t1